MKVFKTKKGLKTYFEEFCSTKPSLGFVPTMGALHLGHLSLVEESRKRNDITIVSIFVNPTQFDKKEDLDHYPKTIENDLILLSKVNCEVVFIPSVEEIYSTSIEPTHFNFDGLEKEMEGKHRKDHFNGVGTIVKILFEIVMPTNAYFGEKDFQQLQIIRKMVEKNQLPINIVGCPIFREENGLAMSSRNKRLTDQERKAASIIYRILQNVRAEINTKSLDHLKNWVSNKFKEHSLFNLEYFVVADEITLKSVSKILPNNSYRAFIAVSTNTIRLIDNISINS